MEGNTGDLGNLAKLAICIKTVVNKLSRSTHNMQVNILQAKNQLSQLIKYARAGDEVVIANRGVPLCS